MNYWQHPQSSSPCASAFLYQTPWVGQAGDKNQLGGWFVNGRPLPTPMRQLIVDMAQVCSSRDFAIYRFRAVFDLVTSPED